MKRPLAAVGFTYLIALAVVPFLEGILPWLLSGLLLLGALGVLALTPGAVRSRAALGTLTVVLLTAALGAAVSAGVRLAVLSPIDRLSGREWLVSGTVVSQPEYTARSMELLLKVESCAPVSDASDAPEAGDIPTGYTARLRSFQPDAYRIGDRLTGIVQLERLDTAVSPVFRARELAYGVRAHMLAVGELRAVSPDELPFAARWEDWREQLLAGLRRYVPDGTEGLAAAVALGERSLLSRETQTDFRLTGVQHLLAISGMHLSVLVSSLLTLLLAFAIPRKVCYTIVIAAMGLYMALAGFPLSVIRAGIMTLLALLGQLFRRENDALNGLGIAVLLICLFDPFAACDPGLQLSVGSTLGILLFSQPLAGSMLRHLPEGERPLTRIPLHLLRSLIRSMAVSFAASLTVLPLTVVYYGCASLVGPLVTLLVGWLLPAVMLAGLLAGLLALIPGLGWLAAFSGWIAGLAGSVMQWVIGGFASLPLVCVYLRRGYVLVWMAVAAAGFWLLWLLRVRPRFRRVFVLGGVCVLLLATLFSRWNRRDVLEVVTVSSDSRGVVLSQLDSAVYLGSCRSGNDVWDLRDMLGASQLTAAILFDCTSDGLSRLRVEYPNVAVFAPVSTGCDALSLDVGTFTLQAGSLYILEDDAHRLAAAFCGQVNLLVTQDGFDAASLPVEITHPDFLVTLGGLSNASLVLPAAAYTLGDAPLSLRTGLLARGVELPALGQWDERPILRAASRYGDDWRLTCGS